MSKKFINVQNGVYKWCVVDLLRCGRPIRLSIEPSITAAWGCAACRGVQQCRCCCPAVLRQHTWRWPTQGIARAPSQDGVPCRSIGAVVYTTGVPSCVWYEGIPSLPLHEMKTRERTLGTNCVSHEYGNGSRRLLPAAGRRGTPLGFSFTRN